MVNKVPKTIKVWYLFFYVNIAKMGACREEDEEEEVVYVGISVREERSIVAEEMFVIV